MRGSLPVLVLVLVASASCRAGGPDDSIALRPPRCVTTAVNARPLDELVGAKLRLLGRPFDVVTSADGQWSFVGLEDGAIAVVSNAAPPPVPVRMLRLPGPPALSALALTHDGRYLLATDGQDGIVVLRVDLAERPETRAIVGTLHARIANAGAIGVATSLDDRLAFVTLEKANKIAVFDLADAVASGFARGRLIGTIPSGLAPVGMAVTPDGRWLYATSELASRTATNGTLSVIDIRIAAERPMDSVVATAPAGCGAVHAAVSPDGSMVWVTARESNSVFAFSTAKLLEDPAHALVVEVPVGQAPVALTFVADGTRLLVAESNRFLASGGAAGVSIIDTAAAIEGREALLGRVPTGSFPRAMAAGPRGTVLVANFNSDELQLIRTDHLP